MSVVICCRYTRNEWWIESVAVNTVCVTSCRYCCHAISLCISQPVCPLLSFNVYLLQDVI